MGVTTTRTGDPGQNYVERTVGDTPNAVSVSTNAKGQGQFEIKLVYATPHDMRVSVADELAAIIEQVKAALHDAGIPLAGQSGVEGK